MSLPSTHSQRDLRVFRWRQEKETDHVKLHDVKTFTGSDGWDLVIVLAPLDTPAWSETSYLLNLYDVPSEFIAERSRGVTHSFGTRRSNDGWQVSWIHFLGMHISNPQGSTDWIKSSLILRWPDRDPNAGGTPGPTTLISFGPTASFIQQVQGLVQHPHAWQDALSDPFVLLDMAYDSWYETLDKSAWEVNTLSQKIEKVTFERASTFDAVQLNVVHAAAKNAIFMTEGIDAALRSLNCAIRRHDEYQTENSIWMSTHDRLLYRYELFHSTRLRMMSSAERLKNIINLAFNINNTRDSMTLRRDSAIMKSLAFLATVFLPISAVSTIFGTQFFSSGNEATTIFPSPSNATSLETDSSLQLDPKFWLLWAVSVPITLVLIGWYRIVVFLEQRKQVRSKEIEKQTWDLETGSKT